MDTVFVGREILEKRKTETHGFINEKTLVLL